MAGDRPVRFVARGVEATAAYDLGPAVGVGFGLPVSLVYDGTIAKDVATGASWDDIVAALV